MPDPVIITPTLLREWPLPAPDADSGKAGRGTVVGIGGARATPGALLLAGLAALRVGAGKLTLATVEATAAGIAVALPEAGVEPLPAGPDGSLDGDSLGPQAADELLQGASAVLFGPGLTGPEGTRAFAERVLAALPDGVTLVADALGLTCGALDAELSRRLGGRVVVTPNGTEAGFLLDTGAEDPGDDPAAAIAQRLGAVVALGGTVVAPDGRSWVCRDGHAGLGTSGSGDVLAGIITGLAARGASPEQAAVWGVYLHAVAGENLTTRVGRLGFLARELLEELPGLLTRLVP